MCVISMVATDWLERPTTTQVDWTVTNWPGTVSKEEFDALKKDVENLKVLLKKAKIYDDEHDQPECQDEEKMEILRKIADVLGIDLEI